MSYILCSYAGTLTTIASDRFVRTDYGDECDCHRLYERLIYWASFSFGEERIGLTYGMNLHMHVHEKEELGKPFNQQKFKIKRNSNLIQDETIMF
jgi:hypothetical protein